METVIVTGFSGKGFVEYGQRFIDTFLEFNSGYPLHLYTDGVPELGIDRIEQFEQSDITGLPEFLAEWDHLPMAAGKEPNDKMNAKERKNKYSYRFDAMKFCKMVYTMWFAANKLASKGIEYMIWLDGDTVVRREIGTSLAERALPAGFDYAYLGREPKHTETGFLVFRLPDVLPILSAWVAYYKSGTYLFQKEWHSAFLFDRAREQFPEIAGYNLTPGGRGHVIHKCWVGGVFDHCKGNRKSKGRSPEAR